MKIATLKDYKVGPVYEKCVFVTLRTIRNYKDNEEVKKLCAYYYNFDAHEPRLGYSSFKSHPSNPFKFDDFCRAEKYEIFLSFFRTHEPAVLLVGKDMEKWLEITAPVVAPILCTECPICLCAFGETDFCITPCGHKFHFHCMLGALEKSNTCPYCRTALPINKAADSLSQQHPFLFGFFGAIAGIISIPVIPIAGISYIAYNICKGNPVHFSIRFDSEIN